MTRHERTAKTIATFTMPAVVDTTDFKKDWKYSGIRFIVTDQADPFMVQYVTGVVRS